MKLYMYSTVAWTKV